jgi:hypothetical protein
MYHISGPMQVPEMLYGSAKVVNAACKEHLARFKGGGSWLDAGSMMEVRDVPGLIMVDGPSALLVGAHVRLYAPFRTLTEDLARREIAFHACLRAVDEALGTAWSLLGLLAAPCYRWFRDMEPAERFLKSFMKHWAEINGVGHRYTTGLPAGEGIWNLPHLLKYVLARRGVPTHRLSEPLPPEGIVALLPRA